MHTNNGHGVPAWLRLAGTPCQFAIQPSLQLRGNDRRELRAVVVVVRPRLNGEFDIIAGCYHKIQAVIHTHRIIIGDSLRPFLHAIDQDMPDDAIAATGKGPRSS